MLQAQTVQLQDQQVLLVQQVRQDRQVLLARIQQLLALQEPLALRALLVHKVFKELPDLLVRLEPQAQQV